jgi:mono/diheme cytochrome c family protein
MNLHHNPPAVVSRTYSLQLPVIALLVLLIAGFARAETGSPPDPESVARGRQLYESYCIACHKRDGVGEPAVPWSIRRPDLVEAMPLNETSHAWHHSDEQLMSIILDGTPRTRVRMPVWRGAFSEKQAADLVAYIKSLWSARIISCQGPRHMDCM